MHLVTGGSGYFGQIVVQQLLAQVKSLIGPGTVADPLTAHTGYGEDERVGGLMAKGAGHAKVAPIVGERCTWVATDESLMH